jgi:hypothetical protein
MCISGCEETTYVGHESDGRRLQDKTARASPA